MLKSFLIEIGELFLIFILVFLPVRILIFEPFVVIGESMEPNFHNADYLIVCKICTKLKDPERGDVIVFIPPVESKKYYIKRVVGLPGEKIVIKNNKIYIFNSKYKDGFELKESYLLKNENFYMEDLEITLGNDEYFVLGDNRNESFDSRKWNHQLKKDKIIGRVILKLSFLGKFINILRFPNI
ncbi:MAG: signal peptidase I [Candidatus Parcubacteria bacterium]|nr:MAG: signal peptidase I [Candidatus Parcubacteria bacterium]